MDKKTKLTQTAYYPLDEINREFLKYAPSYAQEEAQAAISKILDLQKQGVIRDGLYYIVLVDLIGSTKYSSKFGNQKLARRVKYFVSSSFNAFNDANIRNSGLFIKEIGDAVLFIFQHFPDILRWNSSLKKWLSISEKIDEPYEIRTCIHIGEVYLQGVNPLSLAVSHVFKIEKSVQPNKIVLTEPAFSVAWPTIARAYHGFEESGSVELDGFKEKVKLFELVIHDKDDIDRIIEENSE